MTGGSIGGRSDDVLFDSDMLPLDAVESVTRPPTDTTSLPSLPGEAPRRGPILWVFQCRGEPYHKVVAIVNNRERGRHDPDR